MRKVIGMGETVLDIVFRGFQPQAAVPGGSTFNSMVSLGRCGVPSLFLSELGDDEVGRLVRSFMAENGICPDYVRELPMKTPISMAFLDENNDAHYTFYRDPVVERPDAGFPPVEKDDIVLFGSFYALNPATRHHVKPFLDYARSAGAILYYDVNFRPAHAKDLGAVGPSVEENLSLAHIVRGSEEDFKTLYGLGDPDEVYEREILPRNGHFIYTKASEPLTVRDIPSFRKEYKVTPVPVVSTIGAGDNFNAGFVFGLLRYGVTLEDLSAGLPEERWDGLVACAQSFSANCCGSMFNYVTEDFAKALTSRG